MATFALVHGGWHGPWCWEKLTPLLRQTGHDVVTPDLPIDDNTASFDTYADAACAAVDECSDDLILVGHSYGGMVVPLVAARRPVRHLVYLCAYVPDIGKSLADQMVSEPDMVNPAVCAMLKLDEQSRYVCTDPELVRALMYADCDESTVTAAITRLRPHSPYPNKLLCSLAEFPTVPCTSVVCTDDQCIGLDWAKLIARDRLGADLIELPGSHSPHLSRPSALADVLLHLAET